MTSPNRVGPYCVERLLGRGATGTVYEASDAAEGTRVALKVLHARHADDPAVRGALEREVDLARGLSHPGFARVLATGEEEGVPWIAFELVSGPTLQELARRGPMPWPNALRIFGPVADAVAALHARRIVHRDIKPGNIVVPPDGHPKLVDLGIAAAMDSDATRTTAGGGAGTPRYMSPEQVLGHRVGPASDIYSLGICLFETIAGASPYHATSEVAMRAAHVSSWPAALSDVAEVPPALDAVVAVCLSKEAASRYGDARDLREDLAAIAARPESMPGDTVAGKRLGFRRAARALFGRSREMRAIRQWLRGLPRPRTPRLLVIRGCPGSGRTALLEWAAREARRQGLAAGGELAIQLLDDPGQDVEASADRPGLACQSLNWTPGNLHARVIDLVPLGDGALRRWIAAEVDVRHVGRKDLGFLREASGGWPGKVEPLLFRWRERIGRGEPLGTGELGALVDATSAERMRTAEVVDRLRAEARLVLQLASWLFPCKVSLSILATESGAGESSGPVVLGELLGTALGIRMEGDALAFRDTVLPRMIRETTPAELASLLAQAGARLLLADGSGTALQRRAELLWVAEQRDEALRLSRRAAGELLAEGLSAEACDVATEWLDRWGPELGREDLELVGRVVRTLTELGGLDAALRLLERGLPMASERGPLLIERGRILWKQERLDEALSLFLGISRTTRRSIRRGVTDELRRSLEVVRFRAVANAAVMLHERGRPERAASLLAGLEQLAGRMPDYLQLRWLVNRVGIAAEMGDESTVRACRGRAQALVEQIGAAGDIQTLAQADAILHLRRGEVDQALTLLSAKIEDARQAKNLEALAWAQPILATAYLQAGRVSDAETTLRKALRASFLARDATTAGSIYELMARIEAWRGSTGPARRFLGLSRRHSPRDDKYERYRRLAEADLALIEGNVAEGLARLDAARGLRGSPDEEGRLLDEVVALLIDAACGREGPNSLNRRLEGLRVRLQRSSYAFRMAELERRIRRSARPRPRTR